MNVDQDGSRNETSQGNQSTQDRRKLLKRTRSLAVISEDESRQERETQHFQLGESSFDLPRRHQLIPRAKLIDRNSLKDRLYKSQQHLSDSYDRFNEVKSGYSRSACGLHSIQPILSSLPNPLAYAARTTNRSDPDRLNILDWPEPPRRYRSVQTLDTVSGLVDIIEDNWPIEGNRSIDCIYTQVKRKRKEHRSLDSILFEDESELEYFDVLNLLPLSNVRLEFDEEDARNNNYPQREEERRIRRIRKDNDVSCSQRVYKHQEEVLSSNIDEKLNVKSRNVTDEEKCKCHGTDTTKTEIVSIDNSEEDKDDEYGQPHKNENENENEDEDKEEDKEEDEKEEELVATRRSSLVNFLKIHDRNTSSGENSPESLQNLENLERSLEISTSIENTSKEEERSSYSSLRIDQDDSYRARVVLVTPIGKNKINWGSIENEEEEKQGEKGVEENSTTIWISDNDKQEEMSRRPQVLKVVDNNVTKRSHRRSVEIDIHVEDVSKCEIVRDVRNESNDSKDFILKSERMKDVVDGNSTIHDVVSREEKTEASVKNVKNMFENEISREKAAGKTKQIESRFERIVKETSNIFGKACNVVKGSLGFEARSESSDLGLGSEIETDTRRRSVDDNDHDRDCTKMIHNIIDENDTKKNYNNLTRSKSCADSIESQNDAPEFDHVRYKIVKSNVFSKNMYSTGRGNVTYDGLMQYLREYSFQELLLDNNVVIIEPVRAEQIERKSLSASDKRRPETNCKVSNTLQKTDDSDQESRKSNEKYDNGNCKISKQSSIRKHFFYHPIRVNRELIDEELPDPDTVRNVRRMFEDTLKKKNSSSNLDMDKDCKNTKSVSMKDLTSIDSDSRYEEVLEKNEEISRSRCSSRAKDLTKMFESMEKSTSTIVSITGNKEESESPRSESKTRILAQSFEARSGHTSPCDSNSSKTKVTRYQHHHHHHNWDAGSVSSGVSSDYPDTDPGSGVQCTSSEDEDCHYDDDGLDESGPGHYVSQDVLKKIRECGTSVTYYGGKVVNTCNGPLISPLIENRFKRIDRTKNDYVKFKLIKSNSCDSRLELTGRLVERQAKVTNRNEIVPDLRQYTIIETPSIEITTIDNKDQNDEKDKEKIPTETKREPPVVIGLEPKKDEQKESKAFKADFKLGNYEDNKSTFHARFNESALTRWQVNENHWKNESDFGKMEFEEFEVLEDSLNGIENQSQRLEAS
ncbi:PREDICTED: MATH and LRR domain-containing protein PFE0570w [Polistes dominula]|uniref:MATH and LRR domain-containing protein PFE0570w n=1 Tax=Polistes dominula TaxID=743375 RepID=A0ABM1IQL2_POLDO|nr:PREDICTED: MATH and LRR domain-containing protein PFE0570w [Polistes dominula]